MIQAFAGEKRKRELAKNLIKVERKIRSLPWRHFLSHKWHLIHFQRFWT